MTIPTRHIVGQFYNPDGSVFNEPGTFIDAYLNMATWVDTSIVVPQPIRLVVDENGEVDGQLFVNADGVVPTEYLFIASFLHISATYEILESDDDLNIEAVLFNLSVPASPVAPTLAALTNGSVNVTVNPLIPDASGYKILRATASGGPYTQIASGVASFPYNDITVLFSTTYYYEVVATNIAGDSAPSPFASTTTTAITTPDIPTLTMAGVSGLSVHLTTGVTARVQNYQIWRGTSSGTETLFTTVIVALGAALDYTDNTVLDGTTYFYKVKANNTSGTSAFSNEVTAVVSTLPVFTPVDPTAIAGNVLHARFRAQDVGNASDGIPLPTLSDGSPSAWGHTAAAMSDTQQGLIFGSGYEGPNGQRYIGFDQYNLSGFNILQNSGPETTLTIHTLIVAVRFWNNTADLGTLLPDLFIGAGSPDTIRVDGVLQSSSYVLPNGRCSVLSLEYTVAVQFTALGGTAHDWDLVDCCAFSTALIASDRDGVNQFLRTANSLPYQTPSVAATATPSANPKIVIDGDSHSANPTYQTKLAALLPGTYTYVNYAVPGNGINLTGQSSQLVPSYDGTRYCIAIIWAGQNELANATPSPSSNGMIVAFRMRRYTERTLRIGYRHVVVGTATKRNFAGDIGTYEAQRTIFDNFITSNPTLFGNFIADIGAAPNLQNTADTTYFQTDQAHLTGTGYDQVDPIVAAQVAAAVL